MTGVTVEEPVWISSEALIEMLMLFTERFLTSEGGPMTVTPFKAVLTEIVFPFGAEITDILSAGMSKDLEEKLSRRTFTSK